jgi:hypothetical protein
MEDSIILSDASSFSDASLIHVPEPRLSMPHPVDLTQEQRIDIDEEIEVTMISNQNSHLMS